jgi:hypothetical protein
MTEKIIVSFSGGQTSGYMAYLIKMKKMQGLEEFQPVFIFANTGLENEETLEFVDRCDKEFNLGVVWVEAVTNPTHGKGVTHRVTNFKDAYRNHQYKNPDHPFHAHIRKNGIPNINKPQCSDRLKEFAIEHYKKVNTLKGFRHAIGIRIDEITRALPSRVEKAFIKIGVDPKYVRFGDISNRYSKIKNNRLFKCLSDYDKRSIESYYKKINKHNLIYPLIDFEEIDKTDVNNFWESQAFGLGLEEHEGNCQTCWKKSSAKLHLLALEHPERFEAMKWFECRYSQVKPNDNLEPRVFFRGNRSAEDVILHSNELDPKRLRKMIYSNRTADDYNGCSESCNGYNLEFEF